MQYLPVSRTSAPVPHTPVQRRYLTSSIIVPSEGADALLSEAGRLAEADAESSDEEERSPNAFPNDFVEAETTREFLEEDLLSNEDLDQ